MKISLSVSLWFISLCFQRAYCKANEFIISFDKPLGTFVFTNTSGYTTERIKSAYPYRSVSTMVAEMARDFLFLYCSTEESSSIWIIKKIRNFFNETQLDFDGGSIYGFDKHPKRSTFYFTTKAGLFEYNSKLTRKQVLLYESNLQYIKYDSNQRILYLLRTIGKGTTILAYDLREKKVKYGNGWVEYFRRFDIDFRDMVIYVPLADGIYYSYLSVSMDFDSAIDLNALDKLCSAEDITDLSLDEKYVYFVNNSNKIYRYVLALSSVELFMTVNESEKLENIFTFRNSGESSRISQISLRILPAMKEVDKISLTEPIKDLTVVNILLASSGLETTKSKEEMIREAFGHTTLKKTQEKDNTEPEDEVKGHPELIGKDPNDASCNWSDAYHSLLLCLGLTNGYTQWIGFRH